MTAICGSIIIKENGRLDNGMVRYTFECDGQEFHGHAGEITGIMRQEVPAPFRYQWRFDYPNGAHKFSEVYYVR